MKVDKFIRIAIAVLIVLVMLIALAAMLFVTESALNVWDRLREGPRIVLYGYVAAVALLIGASLWFMLRLVVRRQPRVAKPKDTASDP